MTPWLVGLDVGQLNDPSALCMAQCREEQWGDTRQLTYQVRHLERFPLGLSYPKMVDATKRRLEALPLPTGWDVPRYPVAKGAVAPFPPPPVFTLVIDGTGVGRPVVDMFRDLTVWPVVVTLTHGFHETEFAERRNEFGVPKTAVIGATQVALQNQRLKVARGLPDAAVLVKEASNFTYKMHPKTGNAQYAAWREGEHDDLLLAMAVMIWYGEHQSPPRTTTQPRQQYATPTGNVLVGGRR